jgi:hypothetical protein
MTTTLTASPDVRHACVWLVSQTDAAPDVHPELSLDGGRTWEIVRTRGTSTGQSFAWPDTEAPFNRPLVYRAVAGANAEFSAEVPTVLPVQDDAIRNVLRPGTWTTVVVEQAGEWLRQQPQGVFWPLGRVNPVVVWERRRGRTGTIGVATLTALQREDLLAVLDPGSPLVLLDRYGGRAYVAAGDVTEARVSRLGWFQERRWSVDLIEIDRPDESAASSFAWSWGGLRDSGQSWLAVEANYQNWARVVFPR